jgi:hypothetical protein
MSWSRAFIAWLAIVLAESIHGALRQIYVAPVLGDLPARQVGVLIGSAIIFVITLASIRWIGARTLRDQVKVGLMWVVLIVIFEIALGTALGYSRSRMLSDYDLTRGGFMGFGLLFMVFAPALAAKLRALNRDPT